MKFLSVFQNRAYSLPFPEFSQWRKDDNGKDVIDVTWDNVSVTEDCFKKAKDLCSSREQCKTLSLDLDSLLHWQEVLNEKPVCHYINQVSVAVSSAILAKFPDTVKRMASSPHLHHASP